jgi:hypothetical protein
MHVFHGALEQFKNTGYFGLENASLSLGQIEKLIATEPKASDAKIDRYQLHLANVSLIPRYLCDTEAKEHLTVGALTAEERGEHLWDDRFTDLRIVQIASGYSETVALQIAAELENLKKEQTKLEDALSLLFASSKPWDSITFDQVSFSFRGNKQDLSQTFQVRLLESLNDHAKILKKLSLNPLFIDVPERKAFMHFLRNSAALEVLALTIDSADNRFLQDVCLRLANHPKLKCLNLRDTPLDVAAYSILVSLLDENYRIEQIECQTPVDKLLIEQDEGLKRRLSLPGVDRFKQEQLTQNKLVTLASNAVEKGNTRRFAILLGQQGGLLPILSQEEWLRQACRELPPVYANHPDYLTEHAALIQLDLSKPLKRVTKNTVGYFLLAKAVAAKDAQSISHLLKAQANFLEEHALLEQLFDGQWATWKEVVITHFQKNLSYLVPLISHLLPFVEVYTHLNEIKAHLDNYLTELMHRTSRSYLFQILSGVAFRLQDRKLEWKQALGTLVTTIEAGTAKEADVDYLAMDALHQGVKHLVEDARSARRGFLGGSKLNSGLERLGKQLENAVDKSKTELYLREVARHSAQKESPEQAEKVQTLQAQIAKEQKEKAEMAEQAKAREETLKAEIDRARSEIDQVKVQGEKARAELEAQAKMREEKARADMEAQAKMREEKARAELEAQAKVREEKAMAEINDLKAQISQIAQLVSGHAVAAAQEEEPSANEEETRRASFFKTK